jgi:hypothetical protein
MCNSRKEKIMNFKCYLVVNGEFILTNISKEHLIEMSQELREKGIVTAHLINRSVEVEGIYIPAKGINTMIIAVPKDIN